MNSYELSLYKEFSIKYVNHSAEWVAFNNEGLKVYQTTKHQGQEHLLDWSVVRNLHQGFFFLVKSSTLLKSQGILVNHPH